ncbi:hypothetical protein MLD38_021152 [Melastoma candidum]|uniref:Uncharacterized protein n=1 Tax=Melastoma candidum TaxID=119954 RepID=A0ACB9QI37_9MYRT|nr:hypothetical protein MLD38_021152 [Melastoma candidum]
MDPQAAAEKAVSVLGCGYDLSRDIRLTSCKFGPSSSRLIDLDPRQVRDLVFPGGVVVRDVPCFIKCDKGERTRFRSDVLSFNQMSEQFNQELSLNGKIPSGMFNAMFDFKGSWLKDASSVKSLAFDGWFTTLYSVELERGHVTLSEQIRNEVPTSWDPPALAEFIEKYGTHVIVGVKMGGKDVVHLKQLQSSSLHPAEVQQYLKQLADDRFSEEANQNPSAVNSKDEYSMLGNVHGAFTMSHIATVAKSKKDGIESVYIRRGGGIDHRLSHKQWLSTINQSPNVISMAFVPITSLMTGVRGNGFLGHAVNLYLRYKPPSEDICQFLEFQLPRQWAPVYADLPLGPRHRKRASPTLQFTLMGPKLYVNTTQVDTGNRPVTGVRLYLEGKKSNYLAIHLQHLSSMPNTLQILDDHAYEPTNEQDQRDYFEPVKWSIFSHVCTAPVENLGSCIDDTASIVTKAWFEVKVMGMKKVLFLRLGFSMVASSKIRRSEWDGPSTFSRKSGIFSSLISTRFSSPLTSTPERPVKVDLNSAIYPGGPPQPKKLPRTTSFVETREMVRGPEESPGYWVVTGARLCIEGGRIAVKAKYSLLTIMTEESIMLMG